MAGFTEVFGSAPVPASSSRYNSYSLVADATFVWPFNTTGGVYYMADIMEVNSSAPINLNFPKGSEVSVGQSVLVRNTGAQTLTVKGSSGTTLGTVTSGQARVFYVTDNSTSEGTWSVVSLGTGTSLADASVLQGYGLTAISSTLNENHPVSTTATAYVVTSANRGGVLVFTGGSVSCYLPSLVSVGNGFSLRIKNNGSGTITLVPNGGDALDQLQLAPGESLMITSGSSSWVTVGYGRMVSFAFTKLNKDVSAYGGSSVSLSQTEIANKIISFLGNPSGDVTAIFPGVTGVYYLSSALTSKTVTVKTLTGTSVSLSPGSAIVALCDGVNFSLALSSTYASLLTLPNGSNSTPALSFQASVNTGLYSPYPNALSITAGGTERVRVDNSSGVTLITTSNNLDLGFDPNTSLFTGANLRVGGSGTFTHNGTYGDIVLTPGLTSNQLTLNTLKSGRINFTSGNINSDYASGSLLFSTNSVASALDLKSTGVLTSTKGLVDGSYNWQSPSTGFSITLANECTSLILDPAGTLATGSVVLPPSPYDGQVITLTSTQVVTSLTMSANTGKTLKGGLTSLAANSPAAWQYVAGNSTWYRVK